MKSLTILTVVIFIFIIKGVSQNKTDSDFEISVLEQSDKATIIKFSLKNYELAKIETDNRIYRKIIRTG